MKKLENVLERIANSLEEISNSLKITSNYNTQNIILKKEIIKNEENIIEIPRKNEIEEFLNSKNIQIKTLKPEKNEEILDNIAYFMGENFESIEPILKLLKRNINSSNYINLDMKDFTQRSISDITNLCNRLYELTFLSSYIYKKSPKYNLTAKVNKIPEAINFLNGEWFERYLKLKVIKSLEMNKQNKKIKYSYIKNPQIILPNGDDFELDLMFKIDDEIFWIEAKTGEYQNSLKKYSKIKKMLNLKRKNVFVVLTKNLEDRMKSALSTMFDMNVINIKEFENKFLNNVLNLNEHVIDEKIINI
ncbi:hypothetical protein OSSY52_19080 [Tepiditoga spiralis]|uniref:Uncharacterized protein n=1 Tax=Tepiditoga spiralis TaxID=2108365 RepID=A0A7G1G9V0_9BACT|nr:hypothetical protein [Tepiditoga spiralis]BBE31767.1 hypothetical protein OSSY52_19080 [Tepiditoga spiralis]